MDGSGLSTYKIGLLTVTAKLLTTAAAKTVKAADFAILLNNPIDTPFSNLTVDKIYNYNLPRQQQFLATNLMIFMDFLSIGLIFFTRSNNFLNFHNALFFFTTPFCNKKAPPIYILYKSR